MVNWFASSSNWLGVQFSGWVTYSYLFSLLFGYYHITDQIENDIATHSYHQESNENLHTTKGAHLCVQYSTLGSGRKQVVLLYYMA